MCEKCYRKSCKYMRNNSTRQKSKKNSTLQCKSFEYNSMKIYDQQRLESLEECFTGKYTTRKIHKNYIRDPSGLFSIISQVSLSMT